MSTCMSCGGKGKLWGEAHGWHASEVSGECADCDGTGEEPALPQCTRCRLYLTPEEVRAATGCCELCDEAEMAALLRASIAHVRLRRLASGE